MAKERLDIIIEAEVDGAVASLKELAKVAGIELKQGEAVLQQFEDAVISLEKAAKASKTPEELAQLTSQLNQLKKGLTGFKAGKDVFGPAAKGITEIAKQAPNATLALHNFGRVVQDAPFGILGIANNIDPLLSSFQKLKTESGSTGGALKALLAGLTGPAGLAIGVSAVTSLAIAFGPQIAAFAKGLFSGAKGAEELSDEMKSLGNSVAGELVNAQKLASFAGDLTQSYDDRVKAVNALRNAYPDLLKQYATEESALSNILKINGDVIDSILRRATIKGLEAEIEKEVSATALKILDIQRQTIANEQKKTAELQKQNTVYQAVGQSTADAFVKAQQGGRVAGEASAEFAKNASLANQAIENTPIKEIERIKNQLKESIDPLLNLTKGYEDLGVAGSKAANGVAKSVTALTTAEQENAAFLAANLVKRPLDIQLLKQTNEETIAQTAALRALNEQKRIEQAQSALGAGLANPAATIANAQASVNGVLASAAALQKESQVMTTLESQTQNAEQTFNLLAPAIDATFGALASGENVGDALANSLKQVVVQLIAAVAKALILQAILAAFTGGASAATSGGFMKILTGALGFKAAGGPLFGGQPTIVGENGPELITSAGYGNVTPTSQMGGTLSAVVSGNDLLFILNQANSNRRGNFG